MKDFLKKYWMVIIIILLLIILFPVLINIIIIGNNFESNASNDGWVSFFGGYLGCIIGALISSVIMLFVLFETINYQKRENSKNLKIQEQNFNKQIETQKSQFEHSKQLQEDYFKEEQFKESFFKMLSIFDNIVNNLNVPLKTFRNSTGYTIFTKGRTVFTEMYAMLTIGIELASLIRIHDILSYTKYHEFEYELMEKINQDSKNSIDLYYQIMSLKEELEKSDKNTFNVQENAKLMLKYRELANKETEYNNLTTKITQNVYKANNNFKPYNIYIILFFKCLFKVEVQNYFGFAKEILNYLYENKTIYEISIINQFKRIFLSQMTRYEIAFIYIYLVYNNDNELIEEYFDIFKEVEYILRNFDIIVSTEIEVKYSNLNI